MVSSESKVIRHKSNLSWNFIKTEPYKNKPSNWAEIKRKVLVGKEADNSSIHLRYFEIDKGGFSSLEFHKHEHIVICVKGKGRVKIDNKVYKIKPFDIVYVAPNSIHQFLNPYKDTFGFFCIVQSKRDKPKIIKTKEGKGFSCDISKNDH